MAIFADFRVVLDACVLAKFGVADVFLTFVETPRLLPPTLERTNSGRNPPLRGLHKLAKIAFRRNQSLKDYLIDLGCFLPAFSSHVIEAIG